ncbi:MAG TPA: glycine cleavage system protein T, partial [Acidimicrobiales bacterium]
MTLNTSPLDNRHRALGAKMVPFGGWEMPIQYPTGTLAEHQA